jgi:hypothetical protein
MRHFRILRFLLSFASDIIALAFCVFSRTLHLNKRFFLFKYIDHKKRSAKMLDTDSSQLLTIIVNTIEKHGCKLADVDLDNHIINLEGPEKNKEACAKALAKILD